MTPENAMAGYRLAYDQIVRDDGSQEPIHDVYPAAVAIPQEDRGEVMLAALTYAVAMARALVVTLHDNGLDPSGALADHGEVLALHELYAQQEDTPNE